VLALIGLVPTVDLMFVAYTGMGVSCGVLNACFGAIVILRMPEEGRGQAMSMIGGLTRAITVVALAFGGLLGVLLPVRAAFLLVGGIGALVSLAIAITVLWRFGSDPDGPAEPPGVSGSGRQEEPVEDQVPDFGEEPVPERFAVEPVAPAQQRFKGTGDLPDGQITVAR
jgi:MFS family permease